MASEYIDENSPEEALIAYLSDPPSEAVLHEKYGKMVVNFRPHTEVDYVKSKIVKLSSNAVVKFGSEVSQTEAYNQRQARELLHPIIVRVPKVYRYFRDPKGYYYEPRGYIVMEYIDGKVADTYDESTIARVYAIMLGLSTFRRWFPGPFIIGCPRGELFSKVREFGAVIFGARDLERWLNKMIRRDTGRFHLWHYQFVLCHLNVNPRHLLWQDDGSVWLIDWESAGFYPHFFERCSHRIMDLDEGPLVRAPDKFRFHANLIDAMDATGKLSDEENSQANLLLRSWGYPAWFLDPETTPCGQMGVSSSTANSTFPCKYQVVPGPREKDNIPLVKASSARREKKDIPTIQISSPPPQENDAKETRNEKPDSLRRSARIAARRSNPDEPENHKDEVA